MMSMQLGETETGIIIKVLIIIVIAPSLKIAAGRAGGRDGMYPGWLESSLMAAVADGIAISDGSRRH